MMTFEKLQLPKGMIIQPVDYCIILTSKNTISKQQKLNRKKIQQFTFIRNLEREGNTTLFFIIEEAKETILDFPQGTVRVS